MVAGLRDDRFEQDGPAAQRVAAVADAGLDGQVEVAALVDEAADFGGCPGDVEDEHAAWRGISS